jgi:hypothetical protein
MAFDDGLEFILRERATLGCQGYGHGLFSLSIS